MATFMVILIIFLGCTQTAIRDHRIEVLHPAIHQYWLSVETDPERMGSLLVWHEDPLTKETPQEETAYGGSRQDNPV